MQRVNSLIFCTGSEEDSCCPPFNLIQECRCFTDCSVKYAEIRNSDLSTCTCGHNITKLLLWTRLALCNVFWRSLGADWQPEGAPGEGVDGKG